MGGVGVSFLLDVHTELAWGKLATEGIQLHISDKFNHGEKREALVKPGSHARIVLEATHYKLKVQATGYIFHLSFVESFFKFVFVLSSGFCLRSRFV